MCARRQITGGNGHQTIITESSARPRWVKPVEPAPGLNARHQTGSDLRRTLQPTSAADILRLIPNVTTQSDGSDPGIGVNIRGLQDYGRVNVLVDGARQNFAREGHGANGQFYFDPEMMKSVDVTRGPTSTIYGSGAIGGVVSFTTLDAGDVLKDDATFGEKIRGVWETNGPAPLIHGEVAARSGTSFDILGAATLRAAGN